MKQIKNVQITINLPMNFPLDWTIQDIEFYLNDSSYCCNNLIDLLQQYSKQHGCICGITKCRIIDNN